MMESSSYAGAGAGIAGLFILVIEVALIVLMIVALWRIFTKGGQPGWACLIPIYNTYVLLKVAGKPGWWLILMFIPLVNIVISILTMVGLAENFGKGTGFAVGLILLPFIFLLILGYGSAEYIAETAQG